MKKMKKQLPHKTVINLVMHEKSMNDPARALPLFFLALVLIFIFSKFCVVNRLAAVTEAQNELDLLLSQQQALETRLADYNSVTEEYNRYNTQWMNDTERYTVDRKAILDMLEKELMPSAVVQNVAVAANTLTVNLSDVTLEQASKIVSRIQAYDSVGDVSVYTATHNVNNEAPRTVSMTVTFASSIEIKGTEGGQNQ